MNCLRLVAWARDLKKDWLRGTISCPGAVASAALLFLPVVISRAVLGYLIGLSYGYSSVSNSSLYAQKGVDLLKVAEVTLWVPLVENFLVFLMLWMTSGWKTESWWVRPLIVGCFFAALHAVLAADARPLAVLPGFFVMAALITQTKNPRCGFFSSVLLHSLCNSIILIQFFRGTSG
jgi:hypothetical protein